MQRQSGTDFRYNIVFLYKTYKRRMGLLTLASFDGPVNQMILGAFFNGKWRIANPVQRLQASGMPPPAIFLQIFKISNLIYKYVFKNH